MKKLFYLALISSLVFVGCGPNDTVREVNTNDEKYNSGKYTSIPDQNFEQALIDKGYDDTIDGQVLTSNIYSITELDLVSANISDLTGIEAFTALTDLNCRYNQLTSLDVSKNTANVMT